MTLFTRLPPRSSIPWAHARLPKGGQQLFRCSWIPFAAAGLLVLGATGAKAFTYVEPPDGSSDRNNRTDVGPITAGTNTITGTLSCSISSSTGDCVVDADAQDFFTFQLPPLLEITSAQVEITQYDGSPRRVNPSSVRAFLGNGAAGIDPTQGSLFFDGNDINNPNPINNNNPQSFTNIGSLQPGSLYFDIDDFDILATNGVLCEPDPCLTGYTFTLEAVEVPSPLSALALIPLGSLAVLRKRYR